MLTRTIRISLALGMLAFPALAGDETTDACGRDRAQIEALLAEGADAQELSAQHDACSEKLFSDGFESGDISAWIATKQETTATGSIFYEEIDTCGYHPQRRELDCAVEIKQRFGFGGGPGIGSGSSEWILFCVDYQDGQGLVPVNVGSVHLHDEIYGDQGAWYYGISAGADTKLYTTQTIGQTLHAQAILSWTLIPTGCNYMPPWGNQANFKIKLDP